MPKVFLSGGIGNQLFQVAFGHYLNWLNLENIVITKPKLRNGIPHTHLSFFRENHKCKHCRYQIHKGNKHWNELMNPWTKSETTGESKTNVDLRSRPFVKPEEIIFSNSNKVFVGYFQNHKFVKPIEELFSIELTHVLNERAKQNVSKEIDGEYEVIHVRQGDTKSPQNIQKVGVLNRKFYRTLLRGKTNFGRRIVVTDDILGARTVLRGVSIDKFYGPDELDPWESLLVMSRSRRLIAANSTFSWWGGFLAIQNGAEVIIPEPFFVSPKLETNGAFKYPGFREAMSSFMD